MDAQQDLNSIVDLDMSLNQLINSTNYFDVDQTQTIPWSPKRSHNTPYFDVNSTLVDSTMFFTAPCITPHPNSTTLNSTLFATTPSYETPYENSNLGYDTPPELTVRDDSTHFDFAHNISVNNEFPFNTPRKSFDISDSNSTETESLQDPSSDISASTSFSSFTGFPPTVYATPSGGNELLSNCPYPEAAKTCDGKFNIIAPSVAAPSSTSGGNSTTISGSSNGNADRYYKSSRIPKLIKRNVVQARLSSPMPTTTTTTNLPNRVVPNHTRKPL